MLDDVSLKNRYLNFGFIPNSNSFVQNIKGKLFGHINLLKRLQAKDIIKSLDIQSSDRVLDFGCGQGFFTVEMAKLAHEAIGIDINPFILSIQIPKSLEGRLKYIQVKGEELPFPDDHFDRILASEILPMIPDPDFFLRQISRVLKPGGKLVICNGAGHPAIADLYEAKGKKFERLKQRYPERFPSSYVEYERILQESFGTGQTRFLKEADIQKLLTEAGFENISFAYSPGSIAGSYFSWSQFMLYLKTGKTLSQKRFLFNYFLLSLLRRFEKKTYKGGLISCSFLEK